MICKPTILALKWRILSTYWEPYTVANLRLRSLDEVVHPETKYLLLRRDFSFLVPFTKPIYQGYVADRGLEVPVGQNDRKTSL